MELSNLSRAVEIQNELVRVEVAIERLRNIHHLSFGREYNTRIDSEMIGEEAEANFVLTAKNLFLLSLREKREALIKEVKTL